MECDVPDTADEKANCARWVWDGSHYEGRWAAGQIGEMTVERFDADGVLIHRVDTEGTSPGMHATYAGRWTGHAIADAKLDWTMGTYGGSESWSATAGSATMVSLRTASDDAPVPQKAARAASGAAGSAPVSNDQKFASWEPKFHQAWQSDPCVQQRQSWGDYLGWVQRFYYDPGQGWFRLSDAIAQKVSNPQMQKKIVAVSSSLGIRVAGEWSKDDSCRRIDTFGAHGIQFFGGQILQALQADTGNGAAIEAALETVRREVNDVLGTP